jgi:hypothetical protein
MLAAATKNVIIAEPIKNLSTSAIPLLSRLARRPRQPWLRESPPPLHRSIPP